MKRLLHTQRKKLMDKKRGIPLEPRYAGICKFTTKIFQTPTQKGGSYEIYNKKTIWKKRSYESIRRAFSQPLFFCLHDWGGGWPRDCSPTPVHSIVLLLSTPPVRVSRVDIGCPTSLLSTLVVLLRPDQLMVTVHWCCRQSKTTNVNSPWHWSGQEEYDGVDRSWTAVPWLSPTLIMQAEKKRFFFWSPPSMLNGHLIVVWSQETHNNPRF
jgi:hypothetical protein